MEAAREWWLDEVMAEVSKFAGADAQKREEICDWVSRTFGPKAAAAAGELFAVQKPAGEPRYIKRNGVWYQLSAFGDYRRLLGPVPKAEEEETSAAGVVQLRPVQQAEPNGNG
jgi:hypothetical protein